MSIPFVEFPHQNLTKIFYCLLTFDRLEDNVWDVPVVVYCVWTVVLVISSLIVLSCLKRETKKFNKRLARTDNKVKLGKKWMM
jgi:hypothetical protein